MVASGKGGVGKSSVTVNLATALANEGFVVGLMDADIWGFSVPRMTGVDGRIAAVEGKMAPNEKVVGAGPAQGDLYGIPRRGGVVRADVARIDTQPSSAALHRGRRLGRP
ncbi:MAG: P-loop NTPase [Microthrixaceae bacterium]